MKPTDAARDNAAPTIVKIDCARIVDMTSFHDVFAEIFGFPGYYGRNMDAWIDCMTWLDDPDAGMTTLTVPTGSQIVLALDHVSDMKRACPDAYAGLIECSAFVNHRRIESGYTPLILLSFHAVA